MFTLCVVIDHYYMVISDLYGDPLASYIVYVYIVYSIWPTFVSSIRSQFSQLEFVSCSSSNYLHISGNFSSGCILSLLVFWHSPLVWGLVSSNNFLGFSIHVYALVKHVCFLFHVFNVSDLSFLPESYYLWNCINKKVVCFCCFDNLQFFLLCLHYRYHD